MLTTSRHNLSRKHAQKYRGRTATALYLADASRNRHCADRHRAIAQYRSGSRADFTLAVEAASHNEIASLEQHASAAWGSARANA